MKNCIKNCIYLSAVALTSLTIYSCKPAGGSDDAMVAIKAFDAAWNSAMVSKNADSLAIFFADDIICMGEGVTVKGAAAAKENVIKSLNDTTLVPGSFVSVTDTIIVSKSGDLAYERGSDDFKVKCIEGEKAFKCSWMNVWHKVGNQWRIASMMWYNYPACCGDACTEKHECTDQECSKCDDKAECGKNTECSKSAECSKKV